MTLPGFRREAVRLQRQREREEKERKAEEAYQLKIREEAQRKKEAEEMILLLENEEKELILRLRKTQELQQEVRGYKVLNSLLIITLIRPITLCNSRYRHKGSADISR